MNVSALLMSAAIWMLAGMPSASAADLLGPVHHARGTPSIKHYRSGTHARARKHVHTRRSLIARKSVGMMCLLPPDVIVGWHWNGPQCRYIDNIIVVPRRRIVIR